MTVKEQVTQTLESLSEAELEQVAEYLAALKSRSLYAQSAQDDRRLAEAGMAEYNQQLPAEDKAATLHSESSPEDLKPVVAFVETANRASSIGMGLLTATAKGKPDPEVEASPFTPEQLRRMADLQERK